MRKPFRRHARRGIRVRRRRPPPPPAPRRDEVDAIATLEISTPADDPGAARRLVALGLASALVPLNSTMIAVAIPTIAADLGESVGALTQWLVTSYLLVGIVCQSPAGKLGDRLGHGRVFAIGQAIFAAGAIAGFVARGTLSLAGARVLMAMGGAVIVPSAMALVRLRLPPERRGRAFGAFGALMGLAAAIGPVLGGELTKRFGWPSLFLVNALPLVVAAILARGGAAAAARSTSAARFDFAGSLLLGGALAAIVVGAKLRGDVAALLVVGGAVAAIAFVAWELRTADPVVDPRLFREPAFASGALVVALQNFAMYALLFELPAHLAARGGDPRATGRLLFAMTGAMVVASPLGGRLGERLGARTTVFLGAALATASAALLAWTPDARLALPLVGLGAGLGLSTAPSQAAALGAVPAARSGMAAGAMSTLRYLGGVGGIAMLGAVLAGGGDANAKHLVAVRFFVAALACSVVAALVSKEARGRDNVRPR